MGFRIIVGVFAYALALLAQPANPFANDPVAAGVGKGMFRIYCAPCHGIRGQGGRGPDLSRGVFASGEHDADLFRTISRGVAGSEMESYSGVLSDDNIWRVVAYIRSLSAASSAVAAIKGDGDQGRELFWGKGNCGGCHAVAGKGGRSGPDLTYVGRRRSYDYLRTSILDPGADIAEGFRTVTVVTRDGKKITGIERGMDNFTVQLADLSGNFYSFEKSDLRSVQRETRSLMPAYAAKLSLKEVDDLLAYLSTLKQ